MFNQSYDDVIDKFVYRVCTGPGKPGKFWNFIFTLR